MRDTLLPLLRCPMCWLELAIENARRDGQHIVAGTLLCTPCAARWPIVDGVPDFVGAGGDASEHDQTTASSPMTATCAT